MKNQHSFTLIDGNFSIKESREILQNVFSDKIQFHERKNFSSKERFGKEDTTALKRIPKLKKSIDEIIKMLESAENKIELLEIKSEIVINFVSSKI